MNEISINPTPLINRAHVRQKTFEALASMRPHLAGKMTRISEQYYIEADTALRAFIVRKIGSMCSCGKTIK